MSAHPRVSLILVNYNTTDWLANCLDSLKSGLDLPHEIFVVDNASTNREAISGLMALHPEARFIQNDSNRGFAAANNQALPLCSGDWIWLLNPDTKIGGGSLQQWLEPLEQDPKIGIAGNTLRYPEGHIQVSCGKMPGLVSEFFQKNFWNKKEASPAGRQWLERYAQTGREVDWVLGASLFIRRKTCETIGPLDEQFFIYFEETDWCARAKKAGWSVVYQPGFTVIHWRERATSQKPREMGQAYRKSQLLFYRKHHGIIQAAGLALYLRIKYGFKRALP